MHGKILFKNSAIKFMNTSRLMCQLTGQIWCNAYVTDFYLSFTTAFVQTLLEACVKVASDLGFGCSFPQVLEFPSPPTTGLVTI